MEQKRYRLSDFFNAHWDEYKKHPTEYIHEEQYKAVAAIRSCRTASLGVDYYVCETCGDMTQFYHSCKNRFCPTCSWQDTLKWADKMQDQLFDIAHRHVVFTIPHGLNELLKANKGFLLNILFQSASESIKDWMQHKYHLRPGIINVLHTFGETKDLHAHIHMILSWGGIDDYYQLESIKGDYINYEFIQSKFRCKFEDKLVGLYDQGVLGHRFQCRRHFMQFLKHLNSKHWRIHFESSMHIPSEVIRYIGRYSKRACLSEYKITNIEGEFITFKYKDNKHLDFYGKAIVKELRLHYREFFPRLLQHVPLPYFRLVRYCGAYSPRTRAVIKKRNPSLSVGSGSHRAANEDENYELPDNPKVCKYCHTPKVYLYTIFTNKEGVCQYMTRFIPKKPCDKPDAVVA